MKTMALLAITFAGFFAAQSLFGQNVVHRRFLPDVGMSKIVRGVPTIYMNPSYKRRLGPQVYSFFYKHELGHVRLRHHYRNVSVQQKEAEADCFAARNSSRAENIKALQYFRSGRGGSFKHGSPQQRAQRVLRCGFHR